MRGGIDMSQVAAWFGRKFEFTFPVELWPNLCVRLRGTPPRLEEMLQGCSRERLIRRQEQKWSAQEHAGHLLDLEPLWSARVEDYVAAASQLTPADLRNRKTDEGRHNERDLREILNQFRRGRLQMVDRVSKLNPDAFSRSLPHPRLQQPMRLVDHLYFVAEHDDHHLARIWQLLAGRESQ
jgi:uncharacterized damage-inducible protein DinB